MAISNGLPSPTSKDTLGFPALINTCTKIISFKIWIDKNTEASLKWLKKYNQLHHKNIKVSEFFIHYLNSVFVNFISELLMHDIKNEEIEKHLEEYFTFYSNGWMPLIE